MSKQKVIIIACILLSLILVGAITSIHYQVAPKGITVTDDFGRNVTLNGVPARIISLRPPIPRSYSLLALEIESLA